LAVGSVGAVSAALPLFAFAQFASPSSNVGLFGFLETLGNLIALATPVVAALAVLYFFWGLAEYVLRSGDEKKKEEGRNIMIWGVVALFVMISVWGLIRVLQETFDLDSTQQVDIPVVDVTNRTGGNR
jgi:hypothetical protein